MRASDIRSMTLEELDRMEREAREQLFRLRFQISMGQTDSVRKYRSTRKDLARILTIASEKRRKQEATDG